MDTQASTIDAPAAAPTAPRRASALLLLAVLLLAASGLMFELTLTRIFSATIWYHYTFVAISVALFGWGLGGFLVYMLRLARLGAWVHRINVGLALALAVLMPLFPWGILQMPFTPERLNFYFALSLLPFLAGGATLSLLFEVHGRDSNRLYFADLIGASLGVLAVPLVIGWLGAESTMLAVAVLPALAAVLLALALPSPRHRTLWTTVAVLFVAANIALTGWNHRTQSLAIRDAPSKGLYQLLAEDRTAHVTFDRWNAYSRITAVDTPDAYNLARLFIDSDAWTNVLRWDGKPESLAHGRDWFRAFPFRITESPEVMIIGPGGGTDVALALAAGSPKVTAVEMNPLMIEAVARYGDRAGRVYEHPNVHLVMEEGRNFIERTDRTFDVILLGFVDNFAAVSSGGLSLTENYLYTRDALDAYYEKLSDDGALAIIRWPTDVPRLVANAIDFLSRRGMPMEEIAQRVLVVAQHEPKKLNVPGQPLPIDEAVETLFLLSKSPLTQERVDRLLAGHDGIFNYYVPTRGGQPVYVDVMTGNISFDQYTQAFDRLATPVHDDRPFYFANDKPYGMPNFVLRLFQIPVWAVIGFVLLLLLGSHWMGLRTPGPRTVAYFGALGVGFIVCEIALMQRLILLLGHPIYTLVVILFTILLASSLGSLYARRFPTEAIHRKLGVIIGAIIVLLIVGTIAVPPIVRAALPLELPARIALAAAMVFPFGFLMGMPFPLGLRRNAEDPAGAPVSALWGINGVASVAGSIGAIVVAILGGFTSVLLAGAACYAVAWATRPR